MKQTLTLVAAALSLALSVFTLASLKGLPAPAPATPAVPPVPVAAPDPSRKAEADALREELASLRTRLAEAEGKPVPAESPRDPVPEAARADAVKTLEEATAAWKGVQGSRISSPVTGGLEMDASGIGIRGPMVKTLDLKPEQVRTLDSVLQDAWREYRMLEKAHSRRTRSADGTVRVEIEPFEAEGSALRNMIWVRMDAALGTGRQREMARSRLQSPLNRIFQNFGDGKRTLEIRQTPASGTSALPWYEYVEESDGITRKGSGSDLPLGLKRFLEESP